MRAWSAEPALGDFGTVLIAGVVFVTAYRLEYRMEL